MELLRQGAAARKAGEARKKENPEAAENSSQCVAAEGGKGGEEEGLNPPAPRGD